MTTVLFTIHSTNLLDTSVFKSDGNLVKFAEHDFLSTGNIFFFRNTKM